MESNWTVARCLTNLDLLSVILPYYGYMDQAIGLIILLCKKSKRIWEEESHVFSLIIFPRIEQRRIIKPVRVIDYDELDHFLSQNLHLVYRFKLEFDINLDLHPICELITDHIPTNAIEEITFEYKFHQIE
jgi:hypothetical protein